MYEIRKIRKFGLEAAAVLQKECVGLEPAHVDLMLRGTRFGLKFAGVQDVTAKEFGDAKTSTESKLEDLADKTYTADQRARAWTARYEGVIAWLQSLVANAKAKANSVRRTNDAEANEAKAKLASQKAVLDFVRGNNVSAGKAAA